jgi:Protein of unknown function (DUF3137)
MLTSATVVDATLAASIDDPALACAAALGAGSAFFFLVNKPSLVDGENRRRHLALPSGSGEKRRVSFEGLLVEVTLPRHLLATTAVIASRGAFAQFRDWLSISGRRRVELEDPRFAASYDVWGTDQIAARALLTLAFMERLLALRGPASNIDGRPLVVARDNRLTLVIPRSGRDHFLVPGFREAAASRASLIALHDEIDGVLAIADAVIDLDQAARAMAAEIPSRRPPDA